MDNNIKNILKKIDDSNFSSYLVGGFVRDYLLGIKTLDIDICTDALPKDLHNIFNIKSNKYGGLNFTLKNFTIDITTLRKELKYELGKPTEIVYVKTIEEDVLRRDFTINAIYMDKDEKIIDLVNGIDDLNNRVIKMIGNITDRITEDPIRILRAIRLATVLNFEIEDNLKKSIIKYNTLVKKIPFNKIKQELNKILFHQNFQKGLNLLKELKLLEILEITFNDITYVSDICGMWAQLEFSDKYTFTKQETTNIIDIRHIINNGLIDNFVLYKYGLYNSLIGGEILNLNKKEITEMYNKLPIKSINDLDITNDEIINLLNIKPSKIIKEIKNELVDEILNNKLKNDNNELKKYIIKRKE